MIAKRLVIVGVSVAAVLGGTAVVFDQLAGVTDTGTAAPSTSVPPASAGSGGTLPPGASATEDDTSAAPGSEAGGGSGPASGTGESTESPAAPAVLEVLPPVSAAPTGLPLPSPPSALVSLPMPPTASAQGKIVDGFPSSVFPFPDGSVVVSTGVSAADTVLQVTADAISASSQDSVVAHFQQKLAALKFWSEAAPAADGQRSVRFVRGTDSVTLTTSTTGTGSTRFMLLGNLHATAG